MCSCPAAQLPTCPAAQLPSCSPASCSWPQAAPVLPGTDPGEFLCPWLMCPVLSFLLPPALFCLLAPVLPLPLSSAPGPLCRLRETLSVEWRQPERKLWRNSTGLRLDWDGREEKNRSSSFQMCLVCFAIWIFGTNQAQKVTHPPPLPTPIFLGR